MVWLPEDGKILKRFFFRFDRIHERTDTLRACIASRGNKIRVHAFLIGGQTAGQIGTKLSTRIYLDSESDIIE